MNTKLLCAISFILLLASCKSVRVTNEPLKVNVVNESLKTTANVTNDPLKVLVTNFPTPTLPAPAPNLSKVGTPFYEVVIGDELRLTNLQKMRVITYIYIANNATMNFQYINEASFVIPSNGGHFCNFVIPAGKQTRIYGSNTTIYVSGLEY